MSHRNHAFRVRADKFQLSKCNARIHTGFCVGGGERGRGVGGGSRRTKEGSGKDGGLKAVNFGDILDIF